MGLDIKILKVGCQRQANKEPQKKKSSTHGKGLNKDISEERQVEASTSLVREQLPQETSTTDKLKSLVKLDQEKQVEITKEKSLESLEKQRAPQIQTLHSKC